MSQPSVAMSVAENSVLDKITLDVEKRLEKVTTALREHEE